MQDLLRRFLSTLVLLAMTLLANSSEAADYYLATTGDDSNAGSETSPFSSLKKGISVLKPGDTLYVKEGTYKGVIEYGAFRSGDSWERPVKVAAYPGQRPVVVPPGDGEACLYIVGTEYFVLDGFVLDSAPNGHGVGITYGTGFPQAHHIELRNCEIKNSKGQGIGTGGDGCRFINLDVHDNGIGSSDPGLLHGIYLTGDDCLIEGGRYHDNAGHGIHVYTGKPPHPDRNVVRNVRAYGNRKGPGIGVYWGDGNQVYNNVVWENDGGIRSNGVNSLVAHNTVYKNARYGIYVDNKGNTIQNNIAYLNNDDDLHNDETKGTNTLSHNLTSDPKFVNAKDGDFHLQEGSPAIDRGADLSEQGIRTDFEGDKRPQGERYDIGADEFKAPRKPASSSVRKAGLRVGEGVTDITPPTGTELAGFHRSPGKERRTTGVRQPASARALVFGNTPTELFAVVSLDVCAVSQEFCRDVKQEIAVKTGIAADNIRVGATHTHSMPTLRYFRQWGRLPEEYRDLVAKRTVDAVELARLDLAPAELFLGKERVKGASHNRAAKEFKTDDLFTKDSTDDERWLDTTLHALHFVREGSGRNLLWYQFSAHPVCYADEQSGPDFPGLVASKMKSQDGISPSFLQGHCGDVNSGTSGRGDAEEVSDAVVKALRQAIKSARPVNVDTIRQATATFQAPLDIELHKRQLEEYRTDPSKCTDGPWVDAEFAREWYEVASQWNLEQTTYATPISALRLGDVALFFHPGELYSVYGLTLRRDSQFRHTLAIGYVDDLIGYIPDPKAYAGRPEYSAVVVPKIMSLPCFKPTVGRELTAAALKLLHELK